MTFNPFFFKKISEITSDCRQQEVEYLITQIVRMISAASEPFQTKICKNTVKSMGFRFIFPDVKDVPECAVSAGAVPCIKFKLWFDKIFP